MTGKEYFQNSIQSARAMLASDEMHMRMDAFKSFKSTGGMDALKQFKLMHKQQTEQRHRQDAFFSILPNANPSRTVVQIILVSHEASPERTPDNEFQPDSLV